MRTGAVVKLVLGAILIGLGTFVAVRPLWARHSTVTPSRFLDVTFAVVFILRGLVNVRAALRVPRN